MRTFPVMAAVVTLSLVSAYGNHEPERAKGGAATGASTGAVVGAAADPPGVVGGALIGGATGGVAGAATKPNDVSLGPPPWHDNTQPASRPPHIWRINRDNVAEAGAHADPAT